MLARPTSAVSSGSAIINPQSSGSALIDPQPSGPGTVVAPLRFGANILLDGLPARLVRVEVARKEDQDGGCSADRPVSGHPGALVT